MTEFTESSQGSRLIVNIDGVDGRSPALYAIEDAHLSGIVTSISLLGHGKADLGTLKGWLKKLPKLGTGIQLCLTGATPISPPAAIPSLVTDAGQFHEHPEDLMWLWGQDKLATSDIAREIEAQITHIINAGFTIDHLNIRGHLQCIPAIGPLVESAAKRHGITGIRMNVEKPMLHWIANPRTAATAGILGALSWFTKKKMGYLRHGPQSWGYVAQQDCDTVRILEMIGRLGFGSHEFFLPNLSPNDLDSPDIWEGLVSPVVLEAIELRKIQLCSWRDLF